MLRRSEPTLRGRALMWLSQREHSRVELRQKLVRWLARVQAQVQGRQARQVQPADESGAASGLAAGDIEALLDDLQSTQLLSDERFVESRVRARASRFGSRRIELELRQHGVQIDAAAGARLRESELERASAVCRKKFQAPAANAMERARQARFLAMRGFSAETIRAVLRGEDEQA